MRDLVRWQLWEAFGENADALWTRLIEPQPTVAQLEEAFRGGRPRIFGSSASIGS